MLNRILLMCMAVILGTIQLNFGQEAKNDADKLQGTWEIVDLVFRGEALSAVIENKAKISFSRNKMTMTPLFGDGKDRTFSFKLDEKAKPKSVDLAELEGDRKGEVIPGIYRFDGAKLHLCLSNEETKPDRPKEFAAPAGSNFIVITLKRAKK